MPEKKAKTSYNKKCILENTQSRILSLGLAPRIGPIPVRGEAAWMMDARWSGYVSPSGLITG